MSFFRKPKPDLSASLRRLRRRVLSEGETFFRVISPQFGSRDFHDARFDDPEYCSARKDAEDYALDLASLDVGSSVFISERKILDGVQVLVKTREISFEFMQGMGVAS